MKEKICYKDLKIISKAKLIKEPDDFVQYCICKACVDFKECEKYYYRMKILKY